MRRLHAVGLWCSEAGVTTNTRWRRHPKVGDPGRGRFAAADKKTDSKEKTGTDNRIEEKSMSRQTDLCWEALVDETQAVPEAERGAINHALKIIKVVCDREGIHPDSIPQEIHLRADAYRRTFSHCSLTPMALAKHWKRVMVNQNTASVEERALNRLAHPEHGGIAL